MLAPIFNAPPPEELQIVDFRLHLLDHGENGFRFGEDDLPRPGKDHPLSQPVEEFRSVILLQIPDVLADPRLGNAQRRRGPGETPLPGGDVKDLEEVEVSVHNYL